MAQGDIRTLDRPPWWEGPPTTYLIEVWVNKKPRFVETDDKETAEAISGLLKEMRTGPKRETYERS